MNLVIFKKDDANYENNIKTTVMSQHFCVMHCI